MMIYSSSRGFLLAGAVIGVFTLGAAAQSASDTIRTNAQDAERALNQVAISTSETIRTSAVDAERALGQAASASSETMRTSTDEMTRKVTATSSEVSGSLKRSTGEIEKLLKHVEETSYKPYVYPMLVTAAHTGARRSELIRSRVEDIDFKTKKVLIKQTSSATNGGHTFPNRSSSRWPTSRSLSAVPMCSGTRRAAIA